MAIHYLMVITLPNERPISWNAFYSGKHWTKRKAEKDRVHAAVLTALEGMPTDGWPIRQCVGIEIIAYLKNRPMDVDNICTKLYVDAIKGIVIPDDNMQYVETVIPRVRIDIVNPRTVIRILPGVLTIL